MPEGTTAQSMHLEGLAWFDFLFQGSVPEWGDSYLRMGHVVFISGATSNTKWKNACPFVLQETRIV